MSSKVPGPESTVHSPRPPSPPGGKGGATDSGLRTGDCGLTRRRLLGGAAAALGAAALPGALRADEPHPLAARPSHFRARAQRVILFFMNGGSSHVDSFDPKPRLRELHGQVAQGQRKWVASPWEAAPRGKSGLVMTELFRNLNGVADELCLLRSMKGDHNDHFEATLHMHTGSDGSARPGIGAWVSYGLGTANPNLPSHIVFAKEKPYAGSQTWDSNFLPAYHQGVRVEPGDEPIPNLKPYGPLAPVQDLELKALRDLNRRHADERGRPSELLARVLSFDTAASIQNMAPDLFDLGKESDDVLRLYGVERGDNRSFGWQCLMARRMAERGVRFVEVFDSNWDHHGGIKRGHETRAAAVDRPMAALVADLRQRGMLDETLVLFTTEFGRTPHAPGDGRDHHNKVFTCWMAGGGVKGGYAHGASDETGSEPAEKPVHVHDFHATVLHLLGLDHERLTFRYAGRDFRLTDVYGNVVRDILA